MLQPWVVLFLLLLVLPNVLVVVVVITTTLSKSPEPHVCDVLLSAKVLPNVLVLLNVLVLVVMVATCRGVCRVVVVSVAGVATQERGRCVLEVLVEVQCSRHGRRRRLVLASCGLVRWLRWALVR